ncbi:UNVERIFIED_CONTAM: hypothetical protein Sradi_0908800 [Sesamum radiatum]|uniref:DUF599 domain-containing protein n=1 Tax=Sesamum radiatum TaxID=300843 RepID=A0AAW2V3W6_SESRA
MIGEEFVSVWELHSFLKKAAAKLLIVGEKQLDLVLVPLGMGMLLAYHFWLLYTIIRNPRRTVIGLNAESRRAWVFCLMADPLKNGVLAIQTIRNNIMASTLLATTAITLSSLISVYVSNKSSSTSSDVHGNRVSVLPSVKFFAILICFMVAFLCNLLSIRYYAHGSFLVTVPAFRDRKDAIAYVATNLNRGGFFWSLGLRAFYLSVPLFLWVFGPVAMFLCCCVMTCILYFLDTTTSFTRDLYSHSINVEDVESVVHPE